jgi:predicted regulator of Ras-like GTPase activity (Roadblock/LC7/MglB family)
MEDFTAIAARVAAKVGEVRGCLILSRDGLVLGSYPEEDEALVKAAWLRFAALGEAEEGFVEFGGETWCYVRRGPYAAFALTEVGVRPGLVIDEMEACLLQAEELRTRSGPLKVPEARATPVSEPRTSPHRKTKSAPAPATPKTTSPTLTETSAEQEEVDRVLLAQEFSKLLQQSRDDDEA